MNLIKLVIILTLFPLTVLANNPFDEKMILNVNDHEYKMPDIFAGEFQKFYKSETDNIEAEIKW